MIAFLADSNPELRVVFRSLTLEPFRDSLDVRRSESLKAWCSLEFLRDIFETGKCSCFIFGLFNARLNGVFPAGFVSA